jgi:hypothetical protein
MAEKLHTHYDNLKVAQNAPVEVIKAAYKALAQKHHPDRNPGEGSERVMKVLNESWDVLSDPVQRAAHDAWIAEQLASTPLQSVQGEPPPFTSFAAGTPARTPRAGRREGRRRRTKKTGVPRLLGILGSVAVFFTVSAVGVAVLTALSEGEAKGKPARPAESVLRTDPLAPAPRPSAVQSDIRPVAMSTTLADPVVADDRLREQRRQRALLEFGQELPVASGPIIGSRQTHGIGLSTLTIENAHEQSPVVAKVCHAVWLHCWPLHHVYIEPGTRVTLKNLSPGKYDVRHVNLDSGVIFRSSPFELQEVTGAHGYRPPAVSLRLVDAADVPSAVTRIDLREF